MITGYNTDVRHRDVVFHVQTEDKGSDNPFIESLVYVGGQVMAAKRASYAELLADGLDEKAIIELMDRQHRTVIAAIRQGKFDAKFEAVFAKSGSDTSATAIRQRADATAVSAGASAASGGATATAEAPAAEAPAAEAPAAERTLDQVILEYLTSEADQEQLVLQVNGDRDLGQGQSAHLGFRTSSSKSGRPIPGARIQVRMISTVSDPRVLASGETDDAGALDLNLDIPRLDRGTAALIITAASTVGRAEIKHLL